MREEIDTSKKRNEIELTKVGDFPYRETSIKILHFTRDHVWIETPDKLIWKITRPRRWAWINIEINEEKTIKVSRMVNGNRKDETKNYYAYFHAIGENNESIPYNYKIPTMGGRK